MAEPLRLYGLNALVLRAASGVGEAVARTLVKHGATVVAVDGPNSGIERHFSRVKGITGVGARFTDVDALPGIVKDAIGKLGGLDILVNDFSPHASTPIAQADTAFEDMLKSRAARTMAACRAALPSMKKSPAGRIINVGFMRSCFAAEAANVFARAEQDLANLTRSLAVETGEFGITANYIQPGAVMTPESREVFRKDKALRDFCIRGSAARRVGEPVDVAKVVLFLASDDAVFVSGTGIEVDGGRVAQD